jgi:hypothetical protein
MRTISTLLALLCVAPLIRTLAGPLDFWTRTLAVTNRPALAMPGSAAYANGRWVASLPTGIGTNATAMTFVSDDGQNWNPAREQSIGNLTTGNGLFVGVAASGSFPVIVSSADGVAWITRRLPIAGNPQLSYGNGLFWCDVASNNSRDPYRFARMSSPDALTWTIVSTNNILSGQSSSGNSYSRATTFCHDRFLALLRDGEYPADYLPDVQILESFDGVHFTPNANWPLINSIGYLNGTWVGVLATNASMITVSTNGTDWTHVNPGPWWPRYPRIKVANGRFIVAGTTQQNTRNYFLESSDGMTWVDHEVDLFNTLTWRSLGVFDVVEGPNRVLAMACLVVGGSWPNEVYANRLYLSEPLTKAVAPVLGIGRQPALRLESGSVGSGYHIEAADAPNMPWRRLATVYPQAFPFTFLAPEPVQTHRIYRAVARD